MWIVFLFPLVNCLWQKLNKCHVDVILTWHKILWNNNVYVYNCLWFKMLCKTELLCLLKVLLKYDFVMLTCYFFWPKIPGTERDSWNVHITKNMGSCQILMLIYNTTCDSEKWRKKFFKIRICQNLVKINRWSIFYTHVSGWVNHVCTAELTVIKEFLSTKQDEYFILRYFLKNTLLLLQVIMH